MLARGQALGLLYGSNMERTRVSYKEFYNDAINELVDFSEYPRPGIHKTVRAQYGTYNVSDSQDPI